MADYGWLQPYNTKEEYSMNRIERKTETNVIARKTSKLLEE